jgi:RND family efflux transporter MFP subunit
MTNRKSAGPIVGAIVLVALAIGLAFWGISTRAKALSVVTRETRELAVSTVAVLKPERGAPQQEIVLPGTMQAFIDAPIYARTNGYLRQWYADIGARVRAGQVLADIDTPEIDQQLEQARADLATAAANARLAQSTAERYRDLIKTDSVSKQDLDNANGSLEAKNTAVASARANVRRLEQLHAFGRITAPFDGVITARNTDVGALIDSGSNAKELFHEAAVHRLRVFVNVPEIYSQSARQGMKADLTLAEFPGRTFSGVLARTSQSIDVASRTLLTEIDVENAKGELLPGSYAEVHLKLPTDASTFELPVNAVMFRTEGVRVAVVQPDGRIALRPVTLGRDFGNRVEVVSGLSGDEQIVVNPPDSIENGQAVRIAAGAAQP